MSSPESVSSITAIAGLIISIWRISIRFFSPPENPSFRNRFRNDSFISRYAMFSRRFFRNSAGFTFCAPLMESSAVFRNFAAVTPGIATGYWNARKRPSRARSSGGNARTFCPLKRTSPSVAL